MLTRWVVRLGVVLACVAGVVASLTARDSRLTEQKAFGTYIDTKNVPETLRLLDDSETLNPDYTIAIGKARLTPGQGVAILTRAVAKEPENAELWLRLSQQQIAAGDRAAGRRSYARARALAPLLPADGPPPGT